MGRRGPVGKPTRLRIIDGDKKVRINADEPVPRQESPTLPDDAADDVRAVWDRTVAELDVMGLVSTADRDTLRAYCEAVVMHEKASQVLSRSPILVTNNSGRLVPNPALRIQREAAYTIRVFAQEFGLTPAGRTRIRVEEATGHAQEPEHNPFLANG